MQSQEFLLGLVTQAPSAWPVPDFQTLGRKAGVSVRHIVPTVQVRGARALSTYPFPDPCCVTVGPSLDLLVKLF